MSTRQKSKTQILKGSQYLITPIYPWGLDTTLLSSLLGSPLVPCLRPPLPLVVVASPAAAIPCILGFLVTADGMYAALHISAHFLFSRLFLRPTIPTLLQYHMCSTVNGFLQSLRFMGGFWRGISMCHHKASLNSSLYISVPYWDLVRTSSYPLTSQACYILCLVFLPRVDFRSLRPLSLLYTLISCPFSHSCLT